MDRAKSFNLMRTGVALLISFAIAFIIIGLVSDTPLESIKIFAMSPWSNGRYVGNIVESAIPLIFSGLAMSVLFQTGLINLGGEGVYYISGILISAVAIYTPMPTAIHQAVIIVVGAVVGIAVMMIPGFVKAKYGASEMVTSLMLNNILLGVGSYILSQKLRDPATGAQSSYRFITTALLPVIVPGTKIHAGLIVALVCAVLVYLFLYKTKWGYMLRMTGINKDFADYSGISTFMVILLAHAVAGAMFGVGGAVENIGMHKRFEWAGLPGYGFAGCMIAMLANNNPLAVVLAALFIGYLQIGADLVSRLSDVPTEMIAVLESIIVLLLTAERFLYSYRQRWIEKGVKHGNAR